jgi:hypothetical protein
LIASAKLRAITGAPVWKRTLVFSSKVYVRRRARVSVVDDLRHDPRLSPAGPIV